MYYSVLCEVQLSSPKSILLLRVWSIRPTSVIVYVFVFGSSLGFRVLKKKDIYLSLSSIGFLNSYSIMSFALSSCYKTLTACLCHITFKFVFLPPILLYYLVLLLSCFFGTRYCSTFSFLPPYGCFLISCFLLLRTS